MGVFYTHTFPGADVPLSWEQLSFLDCHQIDPPDNPPPRVHLHAGPFSLNRSKWDGGTWAGHSDDAMCVLPAV